MDLEPPTTAPGCASDAELVELVEGRLAGPAVARMEQHAAGCAACRALLDGLAKAETAPSGSLAAGVEERIARAVLGDALVARGAGALDAPGELDPGKVFHGRYEVIRCLRAGGMGAVYEVVHLETKRRRALKVMLPSIVRDPAMRDRFRLEAQITADIDSDHIVETFDAGVDAETGAPFLVMELLRGEDLLQHVAARGRVPAPDVVGLLGQLARVLEQTHARGIVHRDLKPANLFLAVRGEDPPRLKVLDFGIAKVLAQSYQAQRGTTNLGTPLYMAPEQFEGADVSPRTDLFAVGHIAYTLLVGQPYWREETERSGGVLQLVNRLARGPEEAACARAARREVTLPAAFDAWFARATARSASDRFQRASEQLAALAEALGVLPSSATVPVPTTSTGAARGQIAEGARSAVAALTPQGAAPRAEAPSPSAGSTSIPDSPRPARTRFVAVTGVSLLLAAAAALGAWRFSCTATDANTHAAPIVPTLDTAAPPSAPPAQEAGSAAFTAPAGPETASAALPPPSPSAAGRAPKKLRRDPTRIFE